MKKRKREAICFSVGMQGWKFHRLQYGQIQTENIHYCEQSYFFSSAIFLVGTILFSLSTSAYFANWLETHILSAWRRYSSDGFVCVWVIWSFSVKFINTCMYNLSDFNRVEKNHSAFYSASTVCFREIYLKNILYVSNDTLVVLLVIIKNIYVQRCLKSVFLMSCGLKKQNMNVDYKKYHLGIA